MRKILLIAMLSGLLLSTAVFAADISKPEVRKDQVGWDFKTIVIHKNTQQAIVYHSRIDVDGNVVGKSLKTNLIDRADDPGTPEDETLTEFTDLIASLPGIQLKINNAVKAHYGMP